MDKFYVSFKLLLIPRRVLSRRRFETVQRVCPPVSWWLGLACTFEHMKFGVFFSQDLSLP